MFAFGSGLDFPDPFADHELGHVRDDVPRDMLDAITRQLKQTSRDAVHVLVTETSGLGLVGVLRRLDLFGDVLGVGV